MDKEIWIDVEGYEGKYQVSNMGQVRAIYKYSRPPRNHILKGYPSGKRKNSKGYYQITLCNGFFNKNMKVHRLVAMAFIPNPENKPQVNHINGNTHDNRVCNLEWNTNQENNLHAYRELGRKTNSEALKKKVKQISLDGEIIKIHDSILDANKETGIPRGSISSCCTNRKSYLTAGGFKWEHFS